MYLIGAANLCFRFEEKSIMSVGKGLGMYLHALVWDFAAWDVTDTRNRISGMLGMMH